VNGIRNEYRVANHYGELCDAARRARYGQSEVYDDRQQAEERAVHLDRIHDESRCGVHYVQARVVTAWVQLTIPFEEEVIQ
jgi:hypothetical protein